MARKMQEDKFDLNDMLDQLRQMQKMGNLKSILSMLPGVGNQLKDVDIDERQFDRVEAIILSMTPEERTKPDILNPSRKRRIAAGCGTEGGGRQPPGQAVRLHAPADEAGQGHGEKGPGFSPGHGPSRRYGRRPPLLLAFDSRRDEPARHEWKNRQISTILEVLNHGC